jgi:hypothetical protein
VLAFPVNGSYASNLDHAIFHPLNMPSFDAPNVSLPFSGRAEQNEISKGKISDRK